MHRQSPITAARLWPLAVRATLVFTLMACSDLVRGELILVVDPGPVGASYADSWYSPLYDLDEPLGTANFQMVPGKLLSFAAQPNSSWRLNVDIHNHGLSDNYVVLKKLELLDAAGQTLHTNQGQDVVPTQEGGYFISHTQAVSGVASIRLSYSPMLPEVGSQAQIGLSFNERASTGTLRVTAVPEPSVLAVLPLALLPILLRRPSHQRPRHNNDQINKLEN